jgi:hypothetical protein
MDLFLIYLQLNHTVIYSSDKKIKTDQMKHILLFNALILVLFSGCITIDAPGLFNSYDDLKEPDKSKVILTPFQSDISQFNTNANIYAVTGSQLNQCLTNKDSSLIYFWSPRCKGSSCLSLKACQDYCDKYNYNLVVLMEYYDFEMIAIQNHSRSPVLTINHLYYKKKSINKLIRLFQRDLIGKTKLNSTDKNNRFFIFKKGEFSRSQSSLQLNHD